MDNDEFRLLIQRGDIDGVRRALKSDPALANRPIGWFLNQQNESDPLHFVSDCVGQGWLINGTEGEIAEALLASGAAIGGNDARESPLIGAVSLGAERVSNVLIEAGAPLEATSIYGARALHWAAWMGASSTVTRLIAQGADIEAMCSEFGATPLFWAIHGYGPDGPNEKKDQVGAARALIKAGATIDTANKEGVSAIEQSKRAERSDIHALLRDYADRAI
jgi:uncharacterized protein